MGQGERKFGRGTIATRVAIVLVSALLGNLIAWTAPGIDRYTRDWLMRARGVLAPPSDIAIIAIDEKSIQRFGRFPWSRSVMTRAIETLSTSQAKAIALDVLYTDATTPEEDSGLAKAIARAGNVVVAAQLNGQGGGESSWLLPLPQIAHSAAAVGHVNVHAEAESVARELPLRSADDAGTVLYAMPLQVLRIAERVPVSGIVDRPHSMLVGTREIPVSTARPAAVLKQSDTRLIRAARMPIDYIGPAGSFAPVTYSITEILDGSLPMAEFRDKYVLIGATAASLGDRFAAPFTHHLDPQSDQHGSLMPGVEVLANSLNTILRNRFYSEISGWLAFAWAAGIAVITLAGLSVAQGGRESVKQMLLLTGTAVGILVLSFLAYKNFLIFPPLTEQVVAFASASVLGLLRRSIDTGAELDSAIQDMAQANRQLLPATPAASTAEAIARLTGAVAVGILQSWRRDKYRFVAAWGLPVAPPNNSPITLQAAYQFFPSTDVREYRLDAEDRLLLGVRDGVTPPEDATRAAAELARAQLRWQGEPGRNPLLLFPDGLEARAKALGELNATMIERWRFVDLAMRSVEDGLVITGPDGRITFANRAAAGAFGMTEEALTGRNLLDRLSDIDPTFDRSEILVRLLVDRAPVEFEITIRSAKLRRHILRMAPVVSQASGVTGIVVSMSDITRQQELQQTKNDVISLVSHEMRTPLTAIQGMSELLASYDMTPERRREMNLAINDEAKRLTRMISQYLDITRLESGATVLRRSAVRINALVERTLLLLEPLAAERKMDLVRDVPGDLPVVLADSDLLARAVENLVSNAIKYGNPNTPVRISARATAEDLLIEVEDRGAGIAPEHAAQIFEKFFRVPRAENADVPGTGLGLSLVREIAQLHGGAITVRSELGTGTVFTLRLPLGKPAGL